MGRIFRRPPIKDLALPILPPFSKYSRVSNKAKKLLLLATDSAIAMHSSADLPSWAA